MKTVVNTQKLSILYGDQIIVFDRVVSRSKTHKIRISINYKGDVKVSAPKSLSNKELITIVMQRGRWIAKKLAEIEKNIEQVPPRQYVSGETHYYLGKQYLLKVESHLGKKQNVTLVQNTILINTHKTHKDHVQKLLNHWYRECAKVFFQQRLIALLPQTKWVTECPPLKVRKMKRQWGNCAVSGRITLNTNLVKAPVTCIDYVILHELCHIAEHNHSKHFYKLMAHVMPEWKKLKSILDSKATLYLS